MLKLNRIICHCTFDAKANSIKLRYRKQYYNKNYKFHITIKLIYILTNFLKFIYRNILMTIFTRRRETYYI